ncbi:MAG: FHA domain-containing protein [Roseiflexus sp.]|nr:FHA domain-containing protein [Roseiflexus sp.]MCS7288521.1 FHA domain-containing protein [Roseiflexus sp.]
MNEDPERTVDAREWGLEPDDPRREIRAMQRYRDIVRPDTFILSETPCVIGRHRQCDIVIQHSDVSRRHATITFARPYYYLTDENSTNGTFVNGERLSGPYALRAGDMIGLGSPEPILEFYDPDQTMRRTGGLRYDSSERRFYLGETEVVLSPGQHRLLLHLYENSGTVCDYQSCATAVWGRDYHPGMDATALEQTIHGVRAGLVSALRQEKRIAPGIEPPKLSAEDKKRLHALQAFVRYKVLTTRRRQGYLLKEGALDMLDL